MQHPRSTGANTSPEATASSSFQNPKQLTERKFTEVVLNPFYFLSVRRAIWQIAGIGWELPSKLQ
jgi:hypothetical protein